MDLVIATKNKKKLEEIRDLLKGLKFRILSLSDFPDAPKIEEDGLTFEQNALKKATTIAMFTKKLTLREDSGLEVKALKHKPGIYSSRFSGENATDKKNNLKLLKLLRKVPLNKRNAQYKCGVALVDKKRIIYVATAECKGKIALRGKGNFGFGYDPLFIPKGFDKTFGVINPAIKRKISHRAKAFKKLRPIVSKYSQK